MGETPSIWSERWEYERRSSPDTRQISVMAFTESQLGRPPWDLRTLEDSTAWRLACR